MSTPVSGSLATVPLHVAAGDIAVWWNGPAATWESVPLGSGPAGPQGVPGPAGATGPPGVAGAAGATGPAGATGSTGATGVPGPTGPTGATGAQGPAGSANMSGMVAGQIPIAATPTSVTSSIPTSTFVTGGPYLPLTGGTLSGALTGPTITSTGNSVAYNNHVSQNLGAGSAGGCSVQSGDATHAGYISWYAPSTTLLGGARTAYMGFNTDATITLTLTGSPFIVTGGNIVSQSAIITQGAGTVGGAAVLGGDATHTGAFAWYTPNAAVGGGTRTALFGFDSNFNLLELQLNTGVSFQVSGPCIVTGDLSVSGRINAGGGGFGYTPRAGTPGPFRANVFNIDWAPNPFLWIDNVNVGQFAFTCDYRIKENVENLPSTWERVKALRPISYTHAEHGELFKASPEERWGFIAHELQETLIPTAASGYKDAPNLIQSPDLLALIATLTRALQEALARIEALEELQ